MPKSFRVSLFKNHNDKKLNVKDSYNVVTIDPGIVNCGIYFGKYYVEEEKWWTKYIAKLQFSNKVKKSNYYIASINILNEIEKKEKYFSSADLIVIERQMTRSIQNTRMGQHLISYFLTLYDIPIIEINSTTKTQMLDCPKGKTKPEYKKWCRDKAVELLKENSIDSENGNKFIKIINMNKKDDDMGDVVCYFEVVTRLIKEGKFF